MSLYLSNAFSLQMQGELSSRAEKITREEAIRVLRPARDWIEPKGFAVVRGEEGSLGAWIVPAVSIIGHADTAALLSAELGCGEKPYSANRETVLMSPGDVLYVGQYVGPRLPEGTTALPDGSRIEWYIVRFAVASAAVAADYI